MSFLEKYCKGIERGESSTEWRAIELADKEVKELWEAINQLKKRIRYDEADEARLEERLDDFEKELNKLKEKVEEMSEKIDCMENDIEYLKSNIGESKEESFPEDYIF